MEATTTEVTETTETTSNSSPSPSAGRSDPGAAGVLVGKLFARHGRMVLGLCRLLLRDPVEAEDAAQQVFLSAHSAVLRGSPPRDAAPWLAAIARNECRARIHARMREPLTIPDLPSDLPDPLAAAIRAADLEAVWAAIASLPRRQRRALVLREVGGLSYHELGRALGVSHSSVESLLFRARQHVRRLVAAATPFALRDDLARLIPGFDSGNAALVAPAASLPIAVKLATAAVSVGVVTTGAAQFPSHPAHTETRALRTPSAQPARRASVDPAPVVLVSERRTITTVRTTERHGRGRHRSGRDGERGREAAHPEAREQEHAVAEREPADVESAQIEPAELERADDHGGSGNSGPGGGSGSGSADFGSSGSDSGSHSGDG
jgi:RNA polymerase sigma factor (sigma-70 family)